MPDAAEVLVFGDSMRFEGPLVSGEMRRIRKDVFGDDLSALMFQWLAEIGRTDDKLARTFFDGNFSLSAVIVGFWVNFGRVDPTQARSFKPSSMPAPRGQNTEE